MKPIGNVFGLSGMRRPVFALLGVLALASVSITGCDSGERRIGAAGPRPAAKPPGPWLAVTESELATLDENRIGRVGFPGRPVLLERVELEIPPDHPLARGGGIIIVEAIIGVSGKIVKARVLAGPAGPELEDSLVRCLRGWKFSPAVHRGEKWAVSWNLTLEVRPGLHAREGSRDEGQ